MLFIKKKLKLKKISILLYKFYDVDKMISEIYSLFITNYFMNLIMKRNI